MGKTPDGPEVPAPASKAPMDAPALLGRVKEKLAKILWGLKGLNEGERELALKEFLWEMEQLQGAFNGEAVRHQNAERVLRDENDLLRSLLGTSDNELRARVLAMAQEIHGVRKDLILAQEEAAALRAKTEEYGQANDDLRRSLKEARQELEILKAQEDHDWQKQMSGFADEQTALHEQMERLAEKMKEVQYVMATQADDMGKAKQIELAELQARLLQDMEAALSEKENLLWAEEELFARGIAQKLRGELQAAMGRMQFTLDRFHLLDDKGLSPVKTWEQWWRMAKVGPDEFQRSFGEISHGLKSAVETLEEYMALTHRKVPAKKDIHLPDLLRECAASLYADRLSQGALEFLAPDVLPMVQGDPDLLKSAVHVMLENAFEALPGEGGKVRASVDRSPDGKALWLTVTDTGAGLPKGLQAKLFQPFFTTKMGHRGLGLARARRYAEWHRGFLDLVQSTPEGSAFRLTLPVEMSE